MPVTRNSLHLAAVLGGLLLAGPARAADAPFILDRALYVDEKDVPFKAPEGIACDDAGNIVVADTGNGRLLVYRYTGGAMSTGKELKPPGLVAPVRVQYDSKGNVLVLDAKTHKILRVNASGAVTGTVEGRGGGSPVTSLPVAFKVDASDHLYVVDVVSGRVLVFDAGGTVKSQLDLPKGAPTITDVHVDGAGNVYVVDGSAAAIWISEKGTAPFKPFTQGMKDKMNFPTYMTGARGKFYLVDQNGNGVVVLGVDGVYQGRQLAIGWGDGSVYYPAQICVNGNGDVFVADRGNNRVQVFNTSR
jgi:hypothetical protein